ncbi:MAG: NUDIX hydrolase [bacterium]|nr:NUDIX hydrolase [bacterium]MCY4271963.1 NUDIX hydrolase [bacterium]
MRAAVILGGGGLVTRHNEGELEVLMVHRPKHLDWSLPAGKLDPGETLAECALREVYEETGHICELGRELGVVSYTDRRGRARQVHYWEMDAIAGSFAPSAEVDAIAWVPVRESLDCFTSERDVKMVSAFLALSGEGALA